MAYPRQRVLSNETLDVTAVFGSPRSLYIKNTHATVAITVSVTNPNLTVQDPAISIPAGQAITYTDSSGLQGMSVIAASSTAQVIANY
jgi:hypothetical protein